MGGIPWGYGPKQFDVTGGEASLVQLNVPHRGTLRNFNLRVEGGGGGTFELYKSEAAAQRAVSNVNGSSESAAGDMPPEVYVVYSGTLVNGVHANQQMFIDYINIDGTPTNPEPRLWMRIQPDGVGVFTAVLAMTIDGVNF